MTHDNVTDIELIIHRIGLRSHNGADLDRLVVAVPALLTDLATLRKQLENAREALETIEAEMAFPNSLERGFVHRGPTLADTQKRVELAQFIAREALKGQP